MDLERIKELLNFVREHELSEFEVEHDGLRLKVRKDPGAASPGVVHHHSPPAIAPPGGPTAAQTTPASVPLTQQTTEEEIELAVVKSPIVGTFYRSPEPGAPPFVE